MRVRVAAVSLAVLLVAVFALPVSAAPIGQWHRLNPGPAGADELLEHERLGCLEARGYWACVYSKVPEPGYNWDATFGTFLGRAVTSTWRCPAWFPAEICGNVTAVYSGRARYYPASDSPFSVDEQYIVTDRDGQAVLAQYWVGQFVCPWFRTFAEAQAANPGGQFDCILAPAP